MEVMAVEMPWMAFRVVVVQHNLDNVTVLDDDGVNLAINAWVAGILLADAKSGV